MTERFLTVHEVAAEARVSRSTVRHWIRVGRLARTKLGKRCVITRANFEAMIAAGSSEGEPEAPTEGEPAPQAPAFDARRAVELLEAERKMELADEFLRRAVELLTELVGDEPHLTEETKDVVLPSLQIARRELRKVLALVDPKVPQNDPPKQSGKTTTRRA